MHDGHRKRMREKFLNSELDSFAPHEVLELLLYYTIQRKDTNSIAHEMMDEFGSFSAVLDADYSELLKIKGVGQNTALFLKLLPAVFNYYHRDKVKDKKYIRNTTDAGEYAIALIGHRIYEVFYVICLNTQRRIIKDVLIEKGTVNEINYNPRKIVEAAIKYNASSVILVHNHPSGSLHPSENDRIITEAACKLLDSLGISVIDHIIVANNSFTSMSERGLMKN